jgi:hypothetical protein
MSACPGFRILATSREPLHLPDEWVMTVGPLPVANRDALGSEPGDAVELFVGLLGQARGEEPELSSGQVAEVAELCCALDGIPLCIELAAARARTLSVSDIAASVGREALLDFLLEAVADEGTTPFPTDVLAGLRRVVRCEAVSYMEWIRRSCWSSRWPPMTRRRSCRSGMHIHRSGTVIHSPAGHRMRTRCPTVNGSGGLWQAPISSAIANSAAGGSTPRSASRSGCGP